MEDKALTTTTHLRVKLTRFRQRPFSGPNRDFRRKEDASQTPFGGITPTTTETQFRDKERLKPTPFDRERAIFASEEDDNEKGSSNGRR